MPRHSIPRLLLTLALLIAFAPLSGARAQDATPAALVGQPDLAAMVLTPADLDALGMPQYGKFYNGFFGTRERIAIGEEVFSGKPAAEVVADYERFGWNRFFNVGLGLPSDPNGGESPPQRSVITNVLELTSVEGVDDYFTFLTTPGPGTDWSINFIEAPFSLGDRAMIGNHSIHVADGGFTYAEFYVIFQVGNLVGGAGFGRDIPDSQATPSASADAAPSGLDSFVATIEEVETVGRRQLEIMEAVLAGGSANLPAVLLRLSDDPLSATINYSEGYRLINGAIAPYYAGRQDDVIADPNVTTGADAVYELEESFQRGEENVPGDPYFLTRLFHFPDEAAAGEFMASRADSLATGGFAAIPEAEADSREDLLPGEVTNLGDESLAFSFIRSFDDGWRVEGHEIYVRVGDTVAAVSLESPPGTPIDDLAEIAAAQAACLEAGECPDGFPVPAWFTAAPEATPIAATPSA